MQLFDQQRGLLLSLRERPFKLEKDIQNLFEKNIEILSGLTFVKSEFVIKAHRFDTLAYDADSRSFVIIEYKRERNFSVIDQGISYLNLMLEYKAELIVEYNESKGGSLKRTDIDWSQSKVIFVAPSFTDFQRQASNFKDLPIELWEIKEFENGTVLVNPIKKSKSAPSFKQVESTSSPVLAKVTAEIKVFQEDDHWGNKPLQIKELYESYKTALINLINDVTVAPKKLYISFEKGTRIVADVVIQTQELKIYINTQGIEFSDPRNLGVHMTDKTKWGRGYYMVPIRSTANLEYIMSLVKQAI